MPGSARHSAPRAFASAAALALSALLAPGGAALAQGPAPIAAPAQSAGSAGGYAFAAPPSELANRVYSVNRATGEVSACQFERPEGSAVGLTRCFPAGEGAGPQKPGAYDLAATRFAGETGIFRVNLDTGEMSICYVREMPRAGAAPSPMVLCTPQSR